MVTTTRYPTHPTAPSVDAFTITPGAGDLAQFPTALLCDADGTLDVMTLNGTSLTIPVAGGVVLPLAVRRVTAATGPTLVVGLI